MGKDEKPLAPQKLKELSAELRQDYAAGKDQAVVTAQREDADTLIALVKIIDPMSDSVLKQSDPDRLREVFTQIGQIKAAQYPAVVGRDGEHRIIDRPWPEIPEGAKLAMLGDAVDWSGITNRDRGHILLAQIDPGKITDVERNRLIEMAESRPTLVRATEEKAPEPRAPAVEMDMGRER